MYKYLLPAMMMLPILATAQEKEKGKKTKCTVVDAVTKKTVKNVTAIVQGSEEKIVAANGLFQAMVSPGMHIEVAAPGYEERQLMVMPDGKCYVELTADEDGVSDKEDDNDKEE